MTAVLTIISAILIFAVMIFVHELGHFLACRATGVKVREFAIGMGPKLWKKQGKETLYSVRAIPLGGFCAMEGEDTESSDERAFVNKPAWVRLIILAAGAFMNILLGFVLLLVLVGSQPLYVSTTVEAVTADMPAAAAGMQPGDEIVRLDGSRTHVYNDIQFAAMGVGDRPTEIVVRRDGELLTLTATPVLVEGSYKFGFEAKLEENNIFMTVRNSWYETGFYSKVIISSVLDLFTGKVQVSDLSGPIGIVSSVNTAVQESVEHGWEGFLNVLNLAILLTINLGIFNLLPIPALDGGRILFVLVELVRRKRMPPEKEGLVHMIGFAALILLSLFVAFQDILRIW